jgi:hypothetical protein
MLVFNRVQSWESRSAYATNSWQSIFPAVDLVECQRSTTTLPVDLEAYAVAHSSGPFLQVETLPGHLGASGGRWCCSQTFVAWHMLSILPPAQHSVWEVADVVFSVTTLPSIIWPWYTLAASTSWCQLHDSEAPRSRQSQ